MKTIAVTRVRARGLEMRIRTAISLTPLNLSHHDTNRIMMSQIKVVVISAIDAKPAAAILLR